MSRACAIELSACPCLRSVSILQATIFLSRLVLALSLLSVTSTPFPMTWSATTAPLSFMISSVGPASVSPASNVFERDEGFVPKYPGFGRVSALYKSRERRGADSEKDTYRPLGESYPH
jgi:hypothetical protein